MYFLYGNRIPGMFVFCADWEQAHDYAPIPLVDKNIRRLSEDTTYDELVEIADIIGDKVLLPILYKKLSTYRFKYNIPEPAHDKDRYGGYLSSEDIDIPPDTAEESASKPKTAIPVFESKAMTMDMTRPLNRYTEASANIEAANPSFAVQLCLPQIVNFYVDGSCLENTFGGFAAIALDGGRPLAFLSGSAIVNSSNEAEWRAVYLALKSIMTEHHQVFLHTDCMEVVRVMNGAQKIDHRSHDFIQILQEIHTLCQNHDVTVSYIRGHSGNEWNVVADALAKRQAADFRQSCPVMTPAVKRKKPSQANSQEVMQQCLNFPNVQAV